ncbi:hypothetical protein IQA69_07595 [Leptospira borgpetersenii serovar Ballum]|nr:hypothetical protein [Leptospira borgpetersenii]MBE8172839.1 hypothetical protein [Leptospira borgpetersenii serovar Ballum]MBE8176139.1 hypothetical protein [Leptospira borgpetersenii serovar Ballum]MBE8193172.1 hypothetical protein [Leptospira borgpetersenii serovar Ballum]MBE8205660.1 hypothetical protein [Leptospira borgpetersenii serovar Ballum]MBE8217370.1 hypothetical protein [Leptospira borgpetersenii serovar Ballum]
MEHYVATVGSNIELKRGPAFACKGWIRPNFLTARTKTGTELYIELMLIKLITEICFFILTQHNSGVSNNVSRVV